MKNILKTLVMSGTFLCITSLGIKAQDIYSAVAEGNVNQVGEILDKDPSLLNQKNQDQLTPLNLAAEQNQTEVAVLLLSRGADPSIGDRENSQPIHLAAVSGSIPIVDLLLNQGVKINSRDINGMTPLLFAASRGQYDMALHLLSKGADARDRSSQGFTTLQMAAISGNIDMVRLMVAKGVPLNAKSQSGFTALHSAASFGRTEVVKFLVDKGADISAETDEGYQPLAYAIGRNSYESANYLLEKGAEVDHRNSFGMTALHEVAGRGNVPVARLFLDHGADINAANNNGWVPLTYAAWAENADEMTRFLILKGADVNPDPCESNKACTCGPNFYTPLHAACQMGKTGMAAILVENGAKVNILDQSGVTPLHAAVRKGNLDIVKNLVEHGAFLNVKDDRMGATELHLAAELGYGDIAEFLIQNGSSLDATDKNGKTPMDYAFYYGQERIGYTILAAGADESRLESNISAPCMLSASMDIGEAGIWYLGHSGWAVKTANHLLIFDYMDNSRARKPDHVCLSSGTIDPSELKDQQVTVFFTHEHQDHFARTCLDWNDNNPNINYVFCFQPQNVQDEYTYIPVNSEGQVGDMKISVINSTDAGGGYLVEVDGLVLFHMGDHANGNDVLSDAFTSQIDLIAAKNQKIDLVFGPIRGCSLGTPEQVKQGIYYSLDKLQPAVFFPMHSGEFSYEYKTFAETAEADGVKIPIKYEITRGDRFHYVKNQEMTSVEGF